ncbi:MAG: excinuclease ABC subunit UvrA [Candidatus Gracilibacteria bacterium]
MLKQTIGAHDIVILGAKTNTLKNVQVVIPAGKLTVVTGVSGSGKSSLAFQTLYAEGQNRFVECLNTYTRQFIHTLQRPDVEKILNIRPALAIKQENRVRSGRSTVGTTSEIHDYLRILFARVGITYCSNCGDEVKEHTKKDIFDAVSKIQESTKLAFVFPYASAKLDLENLTELGFQRAIVKGKEVLLSDVKEKSLKDQYIVYERLSYDSSKDNRIREAIDKSLHFGKGEMAVWQYEEKKLEKFSDQFRCDHCGLVYQKPMPAFFSYNSPLGACDACGGYGDEMTWDEKKVVPDPSRSIFEGAIDLLLKPSMSWEQGHYYKRWKGLGLPMTIPYSTLDQKWKDVIWKDIKDIFAYLEKKKYKMHVRVFLAKYRGYVPCTGCHGTRLKPEVLNVKIDQRNIAELSDMVIEDLVVFFEKIHLSAYQKQVAEALLQDINARLISLCEVGLSYLCLSRRMNTLSGGESQRLRLATALRSGLSDVLYVLDEPTIGLHPKNTRQLITILLKLRDLGNTVVVVEHEEEVMKHADYIIDMGPGAGEHGGTVVFQGDWDELYAAHDSLTGRYLTGDLKITREKIEDKSQDMMIFSGVKKHNLKNVDATFPRERLTSLTGVSGSGKSTLMEVIYDTLQGDNSAVRGYHNADFKDVIMIDQEPIGKSSRSVPVTYLGFFDPIRKLFADTEDAKKLRLTPGHFSFNSALGQCKHCDGHGERVEEMYFLNDLVVICEFCEGKRYKPKVLKAKYRFRTIADVLNMTVTEAKEFFEGQKKIQQALDTLIQVGLGYVRLGQSALTFSGGEAQRFKIAEALDSHREQRHMLYLMDEPTTGLHFADIQTLLNVCDSLVKKGATIIMIEHNVDMIRNSDWIVELGPEGGEKGGELLYEGTAGEIEKSKKSMIAEYLNN